MGIATGVSHSIQDFVTEAFASAGISGWQEHIKLDENLHRPSDPDSFVGDSSHAREVLGCQPEVDLEGLAAMMVQHDL